MPKPFVSKSSHNDRVAAWGGLRKREKNNVWLLCAHQTTTERKEANFLLLKSINISIGSGRTSKHQTLQILVQNLQCNVQGPRA